MSNTAFYILQLVIRVLIMYNNLGYDFFARYLRFLSTTKTRDSHDDVETEHFVRFMFFFHTSSS